MNDGYDEEVWKLVQGADKLIEEEASFEDIVNYYDNAIQKKPNELSLLYQKGAFLWDTMNFGESLKVMNKILEIDSQYILALRMKSSCLSQIGKDEEAKKYLDIIEKIESEKT